MIWKYIHHAQQAEPARAKSPTYLAVLLPYPLLGSGSKAYLLSPPQRQDRDASCVLCVLKEVSVVWCGVSA